jgi:hypothetical protein
MAAGCAGLDKVTGTGPSIVWSDDFQVNPSINNKKVVCCHDEGMITDITGSTFSAQNESTDTSRVENNMDAMAKRLTGVSGTSQAWATIFRKPDEKNWGSVKAAIKINGINPMIMTRIAVVGKVCSELIKLGMSAENISVYDACHGATGSDKYTPYIGDGLPDGTVVTNGDRNGTVQVGDRQQICTMVVSECDILVNCAVNKGHGDRVGKFTLTMKNHTGTMKFSCPQLQEMIDQNKSALILGGTPVRQQLCIVDSIWASVSGPEGSPTHAPARIVMGTFGPLVDVAVARNIREPVMGASHNDMVIGEICSSFGYSESDIEWDEFTP